jgi:hypothetical protein
MMSGVGIRAFEADNRFYGNAMRAVWGGDGVQSGRGLLVHGVATRADGGGFEGVYVCGVFEE